VPIVEEVFVKKIAYKCGVTEEELEKKKETYLDHLQEDPTLGFQEFKCLYRDLISNQDCDEFLQKYVESIFRAFDANKDDQLTFREWQVGFYLLLLLPKDESLANVNTEDFLIAMEIIFRLYDEDGNARVTRTEVEQIKRLLEEPAIVARLAGGVPKVEAVVEGIDLDKYAGGISLEEFLDYFKRFLEENKTDV